MQRFSINSLQVLARAVSVGALIMSLLLVSAPAAFAGHIQTPAELRDACETSSDHTVILDHATKILTIGQTTPLPVASGCTIILGPGAKFEAEFAPLSFAGPLVIQSTSQVEAKLVKSIFSATAITINLAGSGSALGASESTLIATNGDLRLTLGDESKLEMVNRLVPGPVTGLAATGVIAISAGRKFTGMLDENRVHGAQGVTIQMNGDDSLLKVTQILFTAPQGAVSITGAGAKSLLEMSESGIDMRDGVAVRLPGNDSSITLKQVYMGRTDGLVAPAGVVFEAGAGSASNGKLELSEISIFDVATITLSAALNGQQGVLKVEKADISAIGDILMATGAQGGTAVKENRLASETRIRIATGANGSCLAQPNSFGATPIVEACP